MSGILVHVDDTQSELVEKLRTTAGVDADQAEGSVVSANGNFGEDTYWTEVGTTNILEADYNFGQNWSDIESYEHLVIVDIKDPDDTFNAVQITTTDSGSVAGDQIIWDNALGLPINAKITTSFWAKNNSAKPVIIKDTFGLNVATIGALTGWFFYSFTNTPSEPTVFQLTVASETPGDELDFYIYHLQSEAQDYYTTFTESSRAGGKLRYEWPLTVDTYTCGVWAKFRRQTWGSIRRIIGNNPTLLNLTAGNVLGIKYKDQEDSQSNTTSESEIENLTDWNFYLFSFDGTNFQAYVNNVLKISTDFSGTDIPQTGGSYFYIGYAGLTVAAEANAWMSEWFVVPYVMNANDRLRLYTTTTPYTVNSDSIVVDNNIIKTIITRPTSLVTI